MLATLRPGLDLPPPALTSLALRRHFILLAEVRVIHAQRLHDAPVLGDAHVALQNLRHSGQALAVLLVPKRSRSCCNL